MKRIDKIRGMTIEEYAKKIIDIQNLKMDEFCKSDCEWAKTMEGDLNSAYCVECCTKWLNEELEGLG